MKPTRIFAFLVVAATAISIHAVFSQDKKLTLTTLDLNQSYEILGIVSGFSKVETAVLKDPFDGAWKNAWKDLEKEANSMGADAVIGVRVDFENLTDKMVGRLVIYGTAVKINKTEE